MLPHRNNNNMDEQLKQIGERLRGLRDVLDIPVSEMAETIGIDVVLTSMRR